MSKFYNGKREWFPAYGDLNWQAMLQRHPDMASILSETVWFDSEDGLNVECTQDNTDVFLSRVHDDTDVVLVLDPRDNMRYSYFRDAVGSETFDSISHSLQQYGAAAVHFTLYPQKDMAELWLNKKQGDLSQMDFIPDGWVSGEDTSI